MERNINFILGMICILILVIGLIISYDSTEPSLYPFLILMGGVSAGYLLGLPVED